MKRTVQNLVTVALMIAAVLIAFIIIARADNLAAAVPYDDGCPSNPNIFYDDPACKPVPKPKPVAFRPWQQSWQCNDLRVTVTAQDPYTVNYDIGGTIWGGINFTLWRGQLYLRGVPCALLQ